MPESRPVNSNSAFPLWFQLAQIIRTDILNARLSAGARIEPEVEMAKRYGLSVATVRRALNELEGEGLIRRLRAKGTFVSDDIAPPVAKVSGELEQMFTRAFDPKTTTILEREIVPTPPHLADLFPGESKLLYFRRVVREHHLPSSYATHYVTLDYGRQMDRNVLKRAAMFAVLRDVCGVRLESVRVQLESVPATPEYAEHLDVPQMTPVMLFRGVLREEGGRIVNVSSIVYNGSLYQFVFDLSLEEPKSTGTRPRRH
jgi:GntR family transcriptional regulator